MWARIAHGCLIIPYLLPDCQGRQMYLISLQQVLPDLHQQITEGLSDSSTMELQHITLGLPAEISRHFFSDDISMEYTESSINPN
ncbi:hypothetical protein AVEN_5342-1 [Araneus ventricosus]|uniref:Uncharacterized protein n=1 Tax=Araneus ventricosus TaxID=182803 RepID=A0A4Y2VNM3_ARAVE|nr:hypothetical protein AVEN_5342-1 [Araneus ventricosus]